MLVGDSHATLAAWFRFCVKAGWAFFLAFVVLLLPYLLSATEGVRLRNAMNFVESSEHDFDWTPDAMPADFQVEAGAPDAIFVQALARLGVPEAATDDDKVAAISRHLLAHPQLRGTPIQADLRTTYQRILDDGTGYCGDFTRVFMAFAIAAGIPVRAWSFSFDGFGGHGHVLPEIWNRQYKQWQLVDVFNNYYFVDSKRVAVSALQFRRALARPAHGLSLVPVVAGVRPGYAIEEKAWRYYRRGLPQWYLSWGNGVFSSERAWGVRTLGRVSRSMAQLAGLLQGAYPPIHILDDPDNRAHVVELRRVRRYLMGVAGLGLIAMLSWGGGLYGLWYLRGGHTRAAAA